MNPDETIASFESLRLKNGEIREVWMFISENPRMSYRDIIANTSVTNKVRVHAIMKFLHDCGYITKKGGKTARSYTVNVPLVRGTVTKIQ